VEVEIPIEEAAPVPAAATEIPIEEAAPVPAAAAEIPIEEAAPVLAAAAKIPIEEAAPAPAVEVEIPIEEAAPMPAVAAEMQVVEAAPVPAVAAEIPAPAVAPAPLVESPIALVPGGRAPVVEGPVAITEGARAPVVEQPPASAEVAPAQSFELKFATPVPALATRAVGSNPATAERGSRPRIALEGRRRAGEDLIGELFEIMHELSFAHDVAEGSEFVLSVLNELLPCEGVLIHVFDINTGHFVVVRAKGPHANAVILQRMSDQDPLVRSVMRSTHATSVNDAQSDARFTGPRWQALGVAPRAALCGGVQLSGRYLGLIEVANPLGDVPFHRSELNALDYICEQFATFLSKKPIVLSADVVLSRA
jgi:hypothetical protein